MLPGRSSLIWRGVTELVRSNPAHAYRPVQNRLPPTAADAGCRRGLRRAAECVARGATGGWNDPVPRRAAARRLKSPSRRFSKAAAIPLRTAATSRPESGLQRSSLPVPEVGPRAHSINRKWSLAVIYAEPVGQLNGSAFVPQCWHVLRLTVVSLLPDWLGPCGHVLKSSRSRAGHATFIHTL